MAPVIGERNIDRNEKIVSNVSLVTGCNNTKVSRGMLCMLLKCVLMEIG